MIIDAHTHFYNKKNMVFLNAIEPDKWEYVLKLSQKDNKVFPFIGIHPWDVSQDTLPLVDKLIELSLTCNIKHGIGEIGLDKVNNKDNFDLQFQVFDKLYNYASSKKLPVSIHCVKAWGKITNFLKNTKRTTTMIHGFNTSVEIARELNLMDVFISIEPFRVDPGKLKENLLSISPNMLLIESDGTQENGNSHKIKEAYHKVADIMNMDMSDLERFVEQNGSVFTN